ncbi:MAG TPA: catalase family protein [Longimicrobium sp.]|nr:catalase family protein [Longimicrobium sp.]
MAHPQLAQEQVPPNEAAITRDLAERLKKRIIKNNPTGIMRRDAHPKMHGVVKAEFTVEPDLPEELRVGLFREPKTYRAWIRFSNQSDPMQPDIKKDIRGMAIKLMGVPGEKLLAAEKHEETQDFIVISTNVFVTKNVQEFDGLIRSMEWGLPGSILFAVTHPRFVWNLFKSNRTFANPLQIRYFSTTPYLFGPTAVKYSAIPRVTEPDSIPADPDPDYLRLAMVRSLERGDAFFDFAVQLQTDPVTMPIEDPGAAWSEAASPFRKVATIRVLQQSFDSDPQREFGENLSFTPWHSIPEHRPLGGINRARRMVYDFISAFRHEYNHAPRREPTSWEIGEQPPTS